MDLKQVDFNPKSDVHGGKDVEQKGEVKKKKNHIWFRD